MSTVLKEHKRKLRVFAMTVLLKILGVTDSSYSRHAESTTCILIVLLQETSVLEFVLSVDSQLTASVIFYIVR